MAPGAFNPLSAKIIEQAGFPTVYMTGYGASADLLGAPDYGLLTLTEMANHASRMAQAVNVPVIADGDTGYGNAINVRRTIQEYEKTGVAAIHIEDRSCRSAAAHGRQAGHRRKEFAKKIEAAVDARTDPDFVIIARTDSRAVYDLDEALNRAKMAVAAGADMIFVEAPRSVDELKRVRDELDVPIMANMIEHGKTPLLSVQELEEMGYNRDHPLATRMAARAIQEAAQELKKTGTTAGLIDKMLTFHQFNTLVGLEDFRALEAKYQVR